MFLLINKPAGWTSYNVVAYVRKYISHRPEGFFTGENRGILRPKDSLSRGLPAGRQGIAALASLPRNDRQPIRVGHAGTLDPFATGLLIIGIGREATRRLDEFKTLPKTYVATLRLGAVSDTGDPTGKIRITHNVERGTPDNRQVMRSTLRVPEIPSKQAILNVLQTFLGPQPQTPPMHSAKQVGGVRLYKLARQGKTIGRQPNEIEILNIKILGYSWPLLKIEVTCSPGTYIRTLAEDIGEKLGAGAYCAALERTKIGDYRLKDAQTIDSLLTPHALSV